MSRPLILLVDDFVDACEMYATYLRFCGYEVMTAFNGRDALDLARQHRPELVLLDLRMPGLSGMDVMTELRGDPSTAGAQVLALTAQAFQEDRDSAIQAGFDGFISKPVLPDELRQHVEAALARLPRA